MLCNLLEKIPNRFYLIGYSILILLPIINNVIEKINIPYGVIAGLFIIFLGGFFKKNGTYLSSRIVRINYLFIPLLAWGALLKIMHWPNANTFLIIGFLGMGSLYSFHFLQKDKKGLLDLLKLIWVFVEILGRFFVINHMNYKKEVAVMVSSLLLFFILMLVVRENLKKNPRWLSE